MPDITCCQGGDCPLRNICHRFLVTPDPKYQSYFVTPPYKDDTCDSFWQSNKAKQIKQTKTK